jgi:Arc/MetJ-type ribon-helix-helix transcriptional regulator
MEDKTMSDKKPEWTIGYKEVKNFMHNDLGITKEQMHEIISKIVKEEVKDLVGQNGEFIRYAIREVIKEEMMHAIYVQKYPTRTRDIWNRSKPEEFRKFISDILKEEVVEMLRGQFDISFDFTKKS